MLGQEGAAPPIITLYERAEWVKNKYVTISHGAYVLEGLLSEIGTLPPHNLEPPHNRGGLNPPLLRAKIGETMRTAYKVSYLTRYEFWDWNQESRDRK